MWDTKVGLDFSASLGLKTRFVSYKDDRAWLETMVGMWILSLQVGDCWIACED